MKKISEILICALLPLVPLNAGAADVVDYVSTLVGSESSYQLSTGNTYPAIAMPWGMNFWMPQTGKMGDGWGYTYQANKIRGLKQTHQPSPWINDYGQFSVMPVTGRVVFDEEQRASWFSHKAETARPYYYKVECERHPLRPCRRYHRVPHTSRRTGVRASGVFVYQRRAGGGEPEGTGHG
jgi:putative alpha-1,2-mannosidase